jgi:hypothetical protein
MAGDETPPMERPDYLLDYVRELQAVPKRLAEYALWLEAEYALWLEVLERERAGDG